METIVKQAREVGTSAGVLLPRKWLNRQVVVTLYSPSEEEITNHVFKILTAKGVNKEVKGIYLYGSYAREEADPNSDIDILVLTNNLNKLIKQDNYEILLVSESQFSKNLSNNLHYLSIIREAKTILNKELLEKYSIRKHNLNIRKNLNEVKRIVKINTESVEMFEELRQNIPDGIIYSIILRLRELYLINCLLSGRKYLIIDFLKEVGELNYSSYLRVKRDEKEVQQISPKEIKPLLELSTKWLKELKEQKKAPKA